VAWRYQLCGILHIGGTKYACKSAPLKHPVVRIRVPEGLEDNIIGSRVVERMNSAGCEVLFEPSTIGQLFSCDEEGTEASPLCSLFFPITDNFGSRPASSSRGNRGDAIERRRPSAIKDSGNKGDATPGVGAVHVASFIASKKFYIYSVNVDLLF
jgi:hypothetical protein